MTMTIEKSLNDFNFWGGAASNAAKLTPEELDELEEIMEESSPDQPWSTTEVNDTLWFNFEMVCEWLGLDWEEVMERK